jgi:CheY-like chemotaxis protein
MTASSVLAMGWTVAKAIRLCHRCDVRNCDLIIYSQPALREIGAWPRRTQRRAIRPLAAPAPDEWNMSVTTDILIIEDDPVMRDALAEWLEDAGYRVRKAADGTAGLAAVRLAAPALVVTDIYMPGTNGAVVICELKQGYPEIPVIAISSRFDSGHGMDADAAIALGAARALAKPFKRGELLRAVADLIGSPAG